VLHRWLPGLIVLAVLRWELDTSPSARGTTPQQKEGAYSALCARVAKDEAVALDEYEDLIDSYLEDTEEKGLGWRFNAASAKALKNQVDAPYTDTHNRALRHQFMCNAGRPFDNAFDACVKPPLQLFGMHTLYA
jgi:hypothetical protein